MTRICGVIPAAGRGSRLGLDCPKILVPIYKHLCVWDILRDALGAVAEKIHVVLSPSAIAQFNELIESTPQLSAKASQLKEISVSQQITPRGMGDAIFGAQPFWADFDSIIIVWGDQVNLSSTTLLQVRDLCRANKTMVLPLVECRNPYVQYDLSNGVLTGVRQSREGDSMDEVGFSDVGIFALSVPGLAGLWTRFESETAVGAQTNELNFLPFLPFLSQRCGWELRTVMVADPVEAVGINTQEELELARKRFAGL